MANVTTVNPLVIDTVGVITDHPVRVTCAVFKPSDTAHIVTLTDKAGNTILNLKGHASAAEEQIIVPLNDTRFMGITCTVCTAGAVLYLYTNATCS